jgi:hypothetical protein
MIIKEREVAKIVIEDFTDAEEIKFLKKSTWKHVLFHIFGVLSFGLVYLVFYWYSLHRYLFDDVIKFAETDKVCVITMDKVVVLVEVLTETFQTNPFDPSTKKEIRFIHFIERKYAYDHTRKYFYPIETIFGNQFELNQPIEMKAEYGQGLAKESVEDLTRTFGVNQLSFPEPSVIEMVFYQLINPIIVGLTILAFLCLICYKVMQFITLIFYVIFIIIFEVVEYKNRVKKIKEMSVIDQKVPIFRREAENQSNFEISYKFYLIYPINPLQKTKSITISPIPELRRINRRVQIPNQKIPTFELKDVHIHLPQKVQKPRLRMSSPRRSRFD